MNFLCSLLLLLMAFCDVAKGGWCSDILDKLDKLIKDDDAPICTPGQTTGCRGRKLLCHGSGGDPHVKKWNGKNFNFMGGCDLVLVHSDAHNNGQGLDLHIRTTVRDFYSSIESAAIRLGPSILEVNSRQHSVIVDGTKYQKGDLPLKVSGNELHTMPGPHDSTWYVLKLSDTGNFIVFQCYKEFLSVKFVGFFADGENWSDAAGLMGSYEKGLQYARDGKTVIADHERFGAEWQVRPGEGGDPVLFQDAARAPQWPQEKCRMPKITKNEFRHLLRMDPAFVRRAEEACAHKGPEDFDFCVDDVLATKDIGMAAAY